MVSQLGLLDGVSAVGIVISSLLCGILSIYYSRKLKANLLFYAGLSISLSGLLFLGPTTDFFLVLMTGKNITPIYVYGILSYMWVGPAIIPAMYVGAELMVPEKKRGIVSVYVILAVIFELFLWLDATNSFTFTLTIPGQDLIDASFNRTHPTFIFIVIFLASVLIFLGFGFLIKAKQATGVLRKKFLLMSLGYLDFVISGALDSLFSPGITLFFVRIAMLASSWLIFIGLKA
jgi:hypothetical protein